MESALIIGRLKPAFVAVAVAASVLVVAGIAPNHASSAVVCDKYIAPGGNDSNSGSISSPWATPTTLEYRLLPGQTGCLRGGSYGDIHTEHVFWTSGTAAAPITIRSAPGESAKLVGAVRWKGSYITTSHLEIDGDNDLANSRNGTGPAVSQFAAVNGTHITVEYIDYYQSTPSRYGNGFLVGQVAGEGDYFVARYSKFHDIGGMDPAGFDHQFYVHSANHVSIYSNWIYNNHGGWGVQLYPDASDAHVYGNVFDNNGAGVVIGTEDTGHSDDNVVENNIFTNSVGLAGHNAGTAVSTYWGGAVGTGNIARNNVYWNNAGGLADATSLSLSGNVAADPLLVDRINHNYSLRSGSPAASFGIWDGNLNPSSTTTTTAAPTTTTAAPATTTTTHPATTTTAIHPGTTTTTRPGGTTTTTSAPKAPAPAGATPTVTSPHYLVAHSNGSVDGFGTSQSNATLALNNSIVGIASTPTDKGYWLVGSDGGVFAFGDAQFFGSTAALKLNASIIGIASTPRGGGYWLLASDGGIFAYGDAKFFGSTGSLKLNQPVVGMAATPSGRGYWLVASDGGIFAYGDAAFYGSTGSIHLNKPVVGMSGTAHGYELVASDGGIFAYGDAQFFGSTGSMTLNKPIVALAQTPTGHGYWLFASDGGVFAFGDASFLGSTPDSRLAVGAAV